MLRNHMLYIKLLFGCPDKNAPFDVKVAHELYLYLVAPLARSITAKRLVIVPHEDLHYLPFQALSVNGGDQYLSDNYQISYAPSASLLVSMAPPAPFVAVNTLGVADPGLLNAPREVRALSNHFPGRFETEQLPSETNLRSWLAGRELVHLAVHGSFIEDEPLLSHLHLRPDNRDDGKLTAAEMYGLPLASARMVVLSACETGSVRATHANEVLGMVRGLMFAGAENLLLSAWKIDDAATADWMEAFYTNATSNTPAEAAYAAIQSLRKSPAYQHPYYWSPFLLVSR